MLYVYGQLPLQTLLIVMDATFWLLTYFLIEFLSIISNPCTQVASIITSLGGFWKFFYSEGLRARMRKTKLNEYEINPTSPESPTQEKTVNKSDFDIELGADDFKVTTTEEGNNNNEDKNNNNHINITNINNNNNTNNFNDRLFEFEHAKKTFHYPTLLLFFACIICTTYGSKVLNLILSQNVAPSAESLYLPVKDAAKKELNLTTDTSTLIPDDFDINSRWSSDTILYNINVDYHEVDEFENKMERVQFNDTGFADSFLLMGGLLFSFEVEPGSHLSCGSSDKWTETVMKKGSEVNQLNLPAVPLFPQAWCLNSTVNDSSLNIDFLDLKLDSDRMSSPGDNVTLFGVDRKNKQIYANTIVYESSNFSQSYLYDVLDTYNDIPIDYLSSLFDHLGCDISLDNYNVMFNSDNNQTSYDVTSNITDGLATFINTWFSTDVSFTLGFTLKDNSTIHSVNGTLYNRVIMAYFAHDKQLTVTQAFYRGRLLRYDIHDTNDDNFISQWNSSMSDPIYYADVQILPLAVNIKVSPFVFGVIDKVFGLNTVGYSSVGFYFAGRLRYNVTSIVCSILAVFGLSMFLFILCKIILYKFPQGIPSYYSLLHQYHERQTKVQRPYDAEVERRSLFSIIDKAYEGVGYDVDLQRNRLGVLDEATLKAGVKREGIIRRRLF
ncbi:uncharacterized protein SAPINGB_P002343 [Magnusiomyces paraingens]|uniref:Uncharacterized protein n=1 Tax=Magnusiomyces paraingens TaxID=2606893 RepID=A0A5E8BJA3_9ASCO|nr:uncharacterized protein SAPINGB_P002343 [Saprochaete ingens]VVT49587.1 unnamed protein product [Saprochaete ingens]